MIKRSRDKIAILGAGIAGLSAGYELDQTDTEFRIFEVQETYGGLARSFVWHGFYCDFAAHRFFTSDDNVLSSLLSKIPMVKHVRRSQLFVRGHWLSDPINPLELFPIISLHEKVRLFLDLLIKPKAESTDNFRDFVINRHGDFLFTAFFKPYTEKLFGIPSEEITVSWAKSKVRIMNPFNQNDNEPKNSFTEFYYPVEKGYGAIADVFFEPIKDRINFNSKVISINTDGSVITGIDYEQFGKRCTYPCSKIISTLPLPLTCKLLNIDFPLSFRKVEAVYLLINKPKVTDNHWLYFIDDGISINRMVEFKNFNQDNLAKDVTVICAEVTRDEKDVINKVISDLVSMNLISKAEVIDSMVSRQDYGYPIYQKGYEYYLSDINRNLSKYLNVAVLGRSAEFKHREVADIINQAKKVVAEMTSPTPLEPKVDSFSRKQSNEVCVVLLTYNNIADTLACLQSVRQNHSNGLKVIVVDNGSSDNTPEIILEQFPEVEVIKLNNNIGVPSGFNIGITQALKNGFEYILILNNDTIASPNLIRELLEVAKEDSDCGIVMPRILFHNMSPSTQDRNSVWADGGYYRKFPPGIVLKDRRKGVNYDIPRLVDYAPTCALLIHRRAFEKVGLFDPGYFFFYEDWDFSERLRKAKLNIWCAPKAMLWHKVSKTTSKNPQLYWKVMGESAIRFFRRHNGFLSISVQLFYIILRDFLFKKNLKYLKYYMQGIHAGMFNSLEDYPDISNTAEDF